MNSKPEKIVLNIDSNYYLDWKLFLENELKKINATNLEIDCKNLSLSCTDILELISITNQYNCTVISFCSSSTNTIISSQSLGYNSHFIFENSSRNKSNLKTNDINLSKTHFHQGTVRSGAYLDSPGDLLILGDVNPGAIVRAEGNIIIWGRLLGIAHAGSKGNFQATIAALQLRPVQLRIASKVARGPKEKPQIGLAEQARIDSEEIIISPLESL